MGGLRPEILAIHEAQQAKVAMQSARQRRNQERQANEVLSRAGQPAISNAAGTLAISPATLAAMQLPTVSPIRCEAGEAVLERQT
eukprot:8372616-Pyramimonas_sp.AAC.1